MLTKITLKNFKCFKEETDFPLSKINLLTGINGKGKSTLLQSLLLMRQSIEHNESTNQIYLNGSCVNLGTFEDVKNHYSDTNSDIEISYETYTNEKILFAKPIILKLSYFYENDSEVNTLLKLKKHILNIENAFLICKTMVYKNIDGNYAYSIDDERFTSIELLEIRDESEFRKHMKFTGIDETEKITKLFLPIHFDFIFKSFIVNPEYILAYSSENDDDFLFPFGISNFADFAHIHYCSADRLGPQNFYPKLSFSKFVNVGARGQYTADVLFKNKNNEVYEQLLLEGENMLATQTDAWIDEILGENLKVSVEDTKTDIFILTFYSQNGKTDYYKPSNVGFGYSYILPIIVSGLIAKEGEILIVENPEAHLHPRAQSKLTKFLAKVASCGVQVFIESHSDHILNGLRVCVKTKELAPDDVSVMYFSADKQTDETKIYFPKIDEHGRIDEWQDGFFDEWDNSLMELL